MVTGDFDLSGIGTVTHVEGDRVYGFGHPMFSLGTCEFPMMTGYIHTVYPRASVSMKMGSPLKVVGVRRHRREHRRRRPDRPQARHDPGDASGSRPGRYSEPHTYRVADGPRAEPAAQPGDGRADQRHRHRGEPARGADGPDQGDDRAQGARPDRARRHAERPPLHRPDGGGRAVQPDRLDRQHPGPQPDGSDPDRVDRRARPRSARAGRWPPSSRSGSRPTASSRARRSRRSSR